MFVHGVKPGQPLVLMVKQDEIGLALKEAVLKKCPSLPSSFILMHQGRKVIKKYGNCRGALGLFDAQLIMTHPVAEFKQIILAGS